MITFIDSNIFVYAFDRAYPEKQRLALARIEQARAVGTIALSTQVLHEFYNICRRKLKPELTHEQASLAVNYLCEFLVLGSTALSVQTALVLVQQHQLSWWDALILEAALRADADILVSEDGQHEQRFGKLRLENPFISSS
jgi:predicted nucleic acid-binding protein